MRALILWLAELREMPPVEAIVDFTCRHCGPVKVLIELPNATAHCLVAGHGHAVEAVSIEAHLSHDLDAHLDAIGESA